MPTYRTAVRTKQLQIEGIGDDFILGDGTSSLSSSEQISINMFAWTLCYSASEVSLPPIFRGEIGQNKQARTKEPVRERSRIYFCLGLLSLDNRGLILVMRENRRESGDVSRSGDYFVGKEAHIIPPSGVAL
jgi:hypothetical protein